MPSSAAPLAAVTREKESMTPEDERSSPESGDDEMARLARDARAGMAG